MDKCLFNSESLVSVNMHERDFKDGSGFRDISVINTELTKMMPTKNGIVFLFLCQERNINGSVLVV